MRGVSSSHSTHTRSMIRIEDLALLLSCTPNQRPPTAQIARGGSQTGMTGVRGRRNHGSGSSAGGDPGPGSLCWLRCSFALANGAKGGGWKGFVARGRDSWVRQLYTLATGCLAVPGPSDPSLSLLASAWAITSPSKHTGPDRSACHPHCNLLPAGHRRGRCVRLLRRRSGAPQRRQPGGLGRGQLRHPHARAQALQGGMVALQLSWVGRTLLVWPGAPPRSVAVV